MNGTILAHTDGNTPNLMVKIPQQNEFYLGQLFYFFEFACGISGYLTGVNPFDQPGVESYKKNMFALLGKPGYEERRKELYKESRNSTTVVKGKKIGRNDPCPCGSGKKYKKCCGKNA